MTWVFALSGFLMLLGAAALAAWRKHGPRGIPGLSDQAAELARDSLAREKREQKQAMAMAKDRARQLVTENQKRIEAEVARDAPVDDAAAKRLAEYLSRCDSGHTGDR